MALTRDDVVAAAIRLLDRHGLEALSVRKLAAELNVSAPSLYWHVTNKRQLLDLMATRLVRDAVHARNDHAEPGQPWWDWLWTRFSDMFDGLIATRDAPRVLAGNRPTPDTLPRVESTLARLVDAGMSPVDAQQTLFALGSYVIGSAIEWQSEAARSVESTGPDAGLAGIAQDGEYPIVAAAFAGLHHQDHRATFEFGLRLVIDALRARYAPESLPNASSVK